MFQVSDSKSNWILFLNKQNHGHFIDFDIWCNLIDSGTLTTDTEIIRMSHCGKFYYDDRYF
jgi:hypothetical protein